MTLLTICPFFFAFCDYPDLKRQEKKLHQKKRVIHNDTIGLLAVDLSDVDWDNVLNLSEVDLTYNAFHRQKSQTICGHNI